MINFSLFLDASSPRGVIQIIHGMDEYTGRYMDFAHFFNERGYIVVGQDHPGHGASAAENHTLGKIDGDFKDIVFRQISVTNWLIDTYPDLPLFIFGHSMGSFIAQEHMKRGQNHIKGYILSGSSYKNPLWRLGQLLAFFLRSPEQSPLLQNIVFMRVNSKIDHPETKYDWLSRDKKVVQDFKKDPLTGFPYTGNFYYNFLKFLNGLYNIPSFINVPRTLSILIIAGAEDPIGGYGKRVMDLKNFYQKLNFYDVKFKIYPGCRHELHNEIGKEEVFHDILSWCQETD